MTSKQNAEMADDPSKIETTTQPCFAIMPISDHVDYISGHFKEVYDSIIAPAAEACGYSPIRADEVSAANLIHLDILRRIVDAPMSICDLSSANPNVMFELGIRQAFDKPVVLIKDTQTRNIFDIDSMRTISYNSAMRPRHISEAISELIKAIEATRLAKPEDGINSIVGLLGLHAAAIKQSKDDPTSARMSLIESKMDNITEQIKQIADGIIKYGSAGQSPTTFSAAATDAMTRYASLKSTKLMSSDAIAAFVKEREVEDSIARRAAAALTGKNTKFVKY